MEVIEKLLAGWGSKGYELAPGAFLLLLGLSALSALVVAFLYVRFYGSRATGSEIHRAFPLLGIAITAIFIAIQFSLPLSLGLLGALSIVRFRTPIKEPEEIGFLMVVVATSLACATAQLLFLAGILAMAFVALIVKELLVPVFRRKAQSGLVVLTLDAARYEEKSGTLFALLAERVRRGGLESLTRGDGRVTVTYRFHGLGDAPGLERSLTESIGPASTTIVYAAAASQP